ncbi:MAG: hypothetical protein J5703_02565, partial [Methanomicrobium sp.]|nr:hypothetical protein [Methanomicrobium sp.]
MFKSLKEKLKGVSKGLGSRVDKAVISENEVEAEETLPRDLQNGPETQPVTKTDDTVLDTADGGIDEEEESYLPEIKETGEDTQKTKKGLFGFA